MNMRRSSGTRYPVGLLRNEVDRVFDDVFGNYFGGGRWQPRWRGGTWNRGFPAVNVWEDEERLYAEAEVPGLRMEDLEIYVQGNDLTIKGERRHGEQEGVTYHRRERGTGTLSGTVRLPVEIDVDKVEASLENGVLTIEMPKSSSARPRKIEVKAARS
jgi:HSP20 family protein